MSEPQRGIRYCDRVYVAGINGSGKSILLNVIAAQFRCQRVLYDTKDEFTVPGVVPVHSAERIDWDQPVIHLIDDSGDLDDVDRAFRIFYDRRVGRAQLRYGLIVVCHELADLCADQPGATPRHVSNYVRKGRAHGLGLFAGSQRPRGIPRVCRTEAQHVMSFAGGFDTEDEPVVAGMHRMRVAEFQRAQAQAAQYGEHAYIWCDRRAGTNVIRPPLPESALSTTLASGIDPMSYRSRSSRSDDLTENSGSSPGVLPERSIESGAP